MRLKITNPKKFWTSLTVAVLGAIAVAVGAHGMSKSAVLEFRSEPVTLGEAVSLQLHQTFGSVVPASGGAYTVEHARPCQPGQVDVTSRPLVRYVLNHARPLMACGVLSRVSGHNALTNEGANDEYAHFDRLFRIENGGRHDRAVLSECKRQVLAVKAMPNS